MSLPMINIKQMFVPNTAEITEERLASEVLQAEDLL